MHWMGKKKNNKVKYFTLTLSCPGFFWMPGSGGGVSAAHNFNTIRGIEIKFSRVVENHKLINLV